ncbi:hypothetical protein C8R44DRAFT_816650 [Mycena epipterygia]|nr:hypothetical protein C8R44DRAFT_816650 [Mycena epipterygia]
MHILRQSVIYLFTPNIVDAAVCLTLTRDWYLSASIAGGDTVEWQARVHPDGILTERTTGFDVAYVFWEALTNHDVPMTPPGSPLLNPVEPSLAQSDGLRPSLSTPSRPTSTRRSANSASTPRRARRS